MAMFSKSRIFFSPKSGDSSHAEVVPGFMLQLILDLQFLRSLTGVDVET